MLQGLLQALTSGLTAIATFIPKLLGFLLILLVGYLIAKGLSKLVGLVLGKVGFARLLERAGLQRFLSRVDIDVVGLIVKIVYYFVLLIALQFAFTAFGPNPVEALLSQIISFLPRVIVAIILIVITAAIARILKDLVVSSLGSRPFAPLLGNIVFGIVLALGIIAAINQIGVATTVTTPILVTVLATAGGILVVGAGGGLVRPMQGRWEGWLQSLSSQMSSTGRSDQAARPEVPAETASASYANPHQS